MDYEVKFSQAEKNVVARMGFYKHLAAFFAGNGILTGVDLLTSPGLIWFYWPLLIWTLILGIHGKKTIGGSGK